MTTELWSREELYAEVWERPLVKVAAKYGVSAVALGKVCRKLQIPLPGRGYWTKKEFGKPVEQIPLPKANNLPIVRRLKDTSPKADRSEQETFDPNDPEMVQIAAMESNPLKVDPETKPHKLIAATARFLKNARTDDRGVLVRPFNNEGCLDIRVSKGTLDRALTIMNTIICALESENFPLSMQKGAEGTGAAVFGQRVSFCLAEKSRVKSQQKVKEYSWTRTVKEYEMTGVLEFRIGGYAYGSRNCWRDCKTQALESQLNQCIGALMRKGRQLWVSAELAKQRELERQKKQKELAELAVQINEEEKRVQDLETWVASWSKAEQIRSFVSALERVWTEQGHDLSPDAPKGKRIIWMRRQADRVDPMLPSPPSVLDRKEELRELYRW